MDNVRPFLILGRSQRDFIMEVVRKNLHDWGLAWLARGCVLPTVSHVDTVSAQHWIEARCAPFNAISIGVNETWLDQAGTSFAGHAGVEAGDAGPSNLGRAVAEAALEDLAMLLCGSSASLARPDAGPAQQMIVPGSGFLAFSCQIEGREFCQIVAWPDWVAAFRSKPLPVRQRPQLVHPGMALGSETVQVQAIVGDAELQIGEFATLAVGDVVIIDRYIEQPISVKIEGGQVFAGGHLCASKGRRAVELVAADS